MSEPALPFGREELLDKPGIIGARWWQRSLKAAPDDASRRKALSALLLAGGAVVGVGMMVAIVGAASSSGSSNYRYEPRPALDMQREYGWSFGANTDPLTFDGASTRPFDREALSRLADDLRPVRAEHVPFYVPTLFQSPSALPRSVASEETASPVPLKAALTPIFTPAMAVAYRRGRAVAALFAQARPAPNVMVVVDLPGPEAVAFAAGAISVFDPIFTFDNWPHPRGVVPAHQTLAAAAYFQPLFARRSPRSHALPLLVLDRNRLASYTDDASQFDNRYAAQVPGQATLKTLGISRVLYVAPLGKDKELDDLNGPFVQYAGNGLSVRLVGADAFAPDPGDGAGPPTGPDDDRPFYYYDGNVSTNGWFWHDYPWATPPPGATPPASAPANAGGTPAPPAGVAYAPAARATQFTQGGRPSGFGTVAVVVSVTTGFILGAKLLRSGSWNRSSGGWGG